MLVGHFLIMKRIFFSLRYSTIQTELKGVAKGDPELSHLKDVIRILQFVSTDG